MTVVLILFLIATATLARVMDGLTVSVKNRAYSSALGLADAGLSDALFRIDQQTAATSSFCVGSSSTCTLSAVPALPGIQYRAIVPDYPNSTTPNPDEFFVQSEGSINGQLHALQAVV
jgi:Tfp pilus assembly protein PilX